MLTTTELRTVYVPLSEVVREFLEPHAQAMYDNLRRWCSNVREDSCTLDDCRTSITGEYALHRALFGGTERFLLRRAQMAQQTSGDNGTDVTGARIDVKSTAWRGGDPCGAHLIVPPREHHPETVYVLALVEARRVGLAGWADSDQVAEYGGAHPQYPDRYAVPSTDLIPLPPLRWQWI